MSYISTIDVASRFGLWNHFGSKSETGEEEDKFDLNAGSADEESFQENSEHENKAIFQDSTFMNEDGGFDYDTFTENVITSYSIHYTKLYDASNNRIWQPTFVD